MGKKYGLSYDFKILSSMKIKKSYYEYTLLNPSVLNLEYFGQIMINAQK